MTENEMKKPKKRPGSLFCRQLPVGNEKKDKSYRFQEYVTESLLIDLILIIGLRVAEHYTNLMDGLYGAKYIAVNIGIDLVLIVLTLSILYLVYEGRVKKYNAHSVVEVDEPEEEIVELKDNIDEPKSNSDEPETTIESDSEEYMSFEEFTKK